SVSLLVACDGSGGGACEQAGDCPAGESCVEGECVAAADAGRDGGPDAALDAFVPLDADMADAAASDAGCTPATSCATAGFDCGAFVDDCGISHDCGACTAPQTCGGAGTENVCGCTPATSCATAGF